MEIVIWELKNQEAIGNSSELVHMFMVVLAFLRCQMPVLLNLGQF